MINKDAALNWGGIFFVCGMKQKKGSLFEDFLFVGKRRLFVFKLSPSDFLIVNRLH